MLPLLLLSNCIADGWQACAHQQAASHAICNALLLLLLLLPVLLLLQMDGKVALMSRLQATLASACRALLTNTTAVQVRIESAVSRHMQCDCRHMQLHCSLSRHTDTVQSTTRHTHDN
jgi:hypothetical protein